MLRIHTKNGALSGPAFRNFGSDELGNLLTSSHHNLPGTHCFYDFVTVH